jgi:16S rRNA (cytosine967-C5)-methyltransferase
MRKATKPTPRPLPSPRFHGPHTARTLALQVLFDVRTGDAFVQEILDRHLGASNLSAADRRLATQLAYGVLRRQGTLDALLRHAVTRLPRDVEPWLWEILRLGVFQLALLSHIPPHAALNETVELASQLGRPRAKGFINGVLRALSRLLTGDRGTQPAADMLPVKAGEYRRLAAGVLPEPASSPVEYAAAGLSLPDWLAERWHRRFGWDELLRLGFWFAAPPLLWLRVNPLRTDRAAFLKGLAEAGIAAEAGEHPQAVQLNDSVSIRDLPGYEAGWFSVQDASAMKVASALAPTAGSRILDTCAAPGGKTTHLAELIGNEGQIVACDVDEARLRTVANLAQRLGISIIETRLLPNGSLDVLTEEFDAALVDVPCSNTGVLGRRPEARWRLSPRDFERLVPLQTRLLIEATERVRPGGTIVYSTCSIEPDENQGVVRNVAKALRLELEAEEEQVPGRPADGGYWARLKKAK